MLRPVSPLRISIRFASAGTRHSEPRHRPQTRWLTATAGLATSAGLGTVAYSLLGLKLDSPSSSSSQENHSTSNDDKPSSLPDIDTPPASSSLPKPQSPAPVLSVEEATARLRQGQGSLYFDAGDGHNGRFDYVRYASNSPVEDDYSFGSAAGVGTDGLPLWRYWGIYDGHAGWATSTVLRNHLIPYTASHLGQLPKTAAPLAIDQAIKSAFLALDNDLFANATAAIAAKNSSIDLSKAISTLAPVVSGSCALLSIYDPLQSVLRVACVGDSRAVLGTYSSAQDRYTCRAMSSDQTGRNALEAERIASAHPGEQEDILDTETGRLLGIAVTRAFGDHRWKWSTEVVQTVQESYFGAAPRPKSKTPPYMTAEPVVESTHIARGGGKPDFLIMASDGLWDHISSEDAVTCIEQWIQARKSGTANDSSYARDTTIGSSGPDFELEYGNFATWKITPKDFVVEDDNAATHLVKNAFGGAKRRLFRTVMSAYYPLSRNVRDDVTVHVVFFGSM